MRTTIFFIVLTIYSTCSYAQNLPSEFIQPALVDFDAYESLVKEVKEHRKTSMVNLEEFKKLRKEDKVIILDTRSDSMYNAVHIKGAIHLNFSDFTQSNLQKIIPNEDYKILIYCNNNFDTNAFSYLEPYLATKSYNPEREKRMKDRRELQKRRKVTLALNIPTYINLYGYGYRNVYELSELINLSPRHVKIELEGTAVNK